MAIITRYWAEELDGLLAPGLLASRYAMAHAAADGVVHNGQTAVAADNDLFCRYLEDGSKDLFHLWKTIQATVVAAIYTAGRREIAFAEVGQQAVG